MGSTKSSGWKLLLTRALTFHITKLEYLKKMSTPAEQTIDNHSHSFLCLVLSVDAMRSASHQSMTDVHTSITTAQPLDL